MTIKEFFSLKKNKLFWINILVMLAVLALILFITFKWLDIYTRHGKTIEVPDAKGLDVKTATSLLAGHELQCVVADSTYVKDKKPGSVLEQLPPSGQKVKTGRTIYLTVNTSNVPMVEVPDVADNSSHRQAEARILASGFKLTAPEKIIGEKDWVYGIKYKGKKLEAGEKVPMEATLTLVIGDGKANSEVEEPTDSLSESKATVDRIWF